MMVVIAQISYIILLTIISRYYVLILIINSYKTLTLYRNNISIFVTMIHLNILRPLFEPHYI